MKIKNIFLSVLVLSAMLLSSCAKEESQINVSEFYADLPKFTGKVMVTAEFSDYETVFDFDYSYKSEDLADGEELKTSVITVLSPEALSGVTIRSDGKINTLAYEGVTFEAGPPQEAGLSPAEVLPELMRLWQEGITADETNEKLDDTECIAVTHKTTYNTKEVLYRTWFDRESLKPMLSEVYYGGRRTYCCEFRLVSFD